MIFLTPSPPTSALPKTSRNMEDTSTPEYSTTAWYSLYWRLCVFGMGCFRHTPPGFDAHHSVQVSPYMEFGHVTRFLKAYPDADRVLLLREIASGVFSYYVTRIATL